MGWGNLTVGLHEKKVPWSSSEKKIPNLDSTTELDIAVSDFDGKKNTQKIVDASSDDNITNTSDYAAGFCNLYSISNSDNSITTKKGFFWLPSYGELFIISSYLERINDVLKKIEGATLLNDNIYGDDGYWASKELSASCSWSTSLKRFNLVGWYKKVSSKLIARPVTCYESNK